MPKQMGPLTCTNPFLRDLPVWADAPHHGLARSEFRAFYHPTESPSLPNAVIIGNWIELTLLPSMLRPSMGDGVHCGRGLSMLGKYFEVCRTASAGFPPASEPSLNEPIFRLFKQY